ncbi:hypothetical protein O181_032775 [Austropuccinia psidii MF-1]|uniref:Chromo domain-containing protein n=1 Tax=Austropuccinia psidii MF-1 TaxID=1389203 RepID=A0A9Q3H8J2_9BASI|nr:hypothetical protein [Austropuccinia psidii MF-1]
MQNIHQQSNHPFLPFMEEISAFPQPIFLKTHLLESYQQTSNKYSKFSKNNWIWLASKNIKTTRLTKKLQERWLGPFEVIKKIGSHSYHLKLPFQWKSVHPVFHVSLLEPVKQSRISNHNQLPPPVLVEEKEEWQVAQVLDSKLRRGKLWYLVEWKGFSKHPERTAWEPSSSLNSSPDLVKDFHSLYQDKPGPITSRILFYDAWWGEEVIKVSSSPGMHL